MQEAMTFQSFSHFGRVLANFAQHTASNNNNSSSSNMNSARRRLRQRADTGGGTSSKTVNLRLKTATVRSVSVRLNLKDVAQPLGLPDNWQCHSVSHTVDIDPIVVGDDTFAFRLEIMLYRKSSKRNALQADLLLTRGHLTCGHLVFVRGTLTTEPWDVERPVDGGWRKVGEREYEDHFLTQVSMTLPLSEVTTKERVIFCKVEVMATPTFEDETVAKTQPNTTHVKNDKLACGNAGSSGSVESLQEFCRDLRQTLPDFAVTSGDCRIPCHRAVLALNSQPLRAMLESAKMREAAEGQMELPDLDEDALKVLVDHLYRQDVEMKSLETARMLLPVADRFGLDRLKTMCERKMLGEICLDSILDLVDLAELFELTRLRERAVLFLGSNLTKLLEEKPKQWERLNRNKALLKEALEKRSGKT